jgi:hypothetical protein
VGGSPGDDVAAVAHYGDWCPYYTRPEKFFSHLAAIARQQIRHPFGVAVLEKRYVRHSADHFSTGIVSQARMPRKARMR